MPFREKVKLAMQRIRPFVSGLMFERRLDVETSRTLTRTEMGYDDERLVPYEPSEWRTLQRAMRRRSVGPEDVFLDLGSGMGRMVVQAAGYPFARVIGVELSPELHAIAQRNVARNQKRVRCGNIELVLSDAVSYEPPDDVSVLFLNNPFNDEVFQAAMARMFQSVSRHPRRVRLMYRNPVEHDWLMATGRVRVAGEWQKGAWNGRGRGVMIRSYEVVSGSA